MTISDKLNSNHLLRVHSERLYLYLLLVRTEPGLFIPFDLDRLTAPVFSEAKLIRLLRDFGFTTMGVIGRIPSNGLSS